MEIDLEQYRKFQSTINKKDVFGMIVEKKEFLEILDFPNLEVLSFEISNVNNIQKKFGKLNKLKFLGIGYANLTNFSESIKNLNNLETLSLWDNEIKQIPSWIRKLKKFSIINY